MELYSDGEIREPAHYQCVVYGGRLLAHLSADDPQLNEEEVVKILRVNRHALLIMDSDKRKPRQRLNSTKRRIISEIQEFGDMVWVTAGKEVENYIPTDALRSYYSDANLPHLDQYATISEYLDKIKVGEGKRFSNNKVLFAEKLVPHITKESMKEALDLEKKVREAHDRILDWNGITPN